MILCAPLLAGWAVFALSQGNIWLLYLGRILQGLGVMSSVTQVYLVEIADTERRGLFGASGALSVSVGITLVYCLGVSISLHFTHRSQIIIGSWVYFISKAVKSVWWYFWGYLGKDI